jgi:hypothetical protein
MKKLTSTFSSSASEVSDLSTEMGNLTEAAIPTSPTASLEAFVAASPRLALEPMNSIVDKRLLPQLDQIFDKLVSEGLNTTMDGVKIFGQTAVDKFLPGKIAIGLSYLLINTPGTHPKFEAYLSGYRQIMDMTINQLNESWGMYYYVSALNKLRLAGLLEKAIAPETLIQLKKQLDWKVFVDTQDYTLIRLPTNYYGVAFSVSRLRYNMGWEDAQGSEILLQKMLNHYKTFSDFGFSDETDGDGRFDRYSILLIGEIMQRLIETGMEVSAADEASLRKWLRQAVDLIKMQMNPAGNGIDFGRSLSCYADTAHSEVLSAAAHLNVLTLAEKEMAYAYATRITAKYVDFWLDADMQSVNLWEKGRRTDAYRNKSRILGENLSLAHQLIYTNNLWKADGFATRAPISHAQFKADLDALPIYMFTKFAGFDGKPDTYDRALLTYRDGYRIFTLPMINGAKQYHHTNPYFPVPHSSNLLCGVADAKWPALLPKFTTADGQPLIPTCYIKNIQVKAYGAKVTVSYDNDAMDLSEASEPVRDIRMTSKTQITFEPGKISRIDSFSPAAELQLKSVEMELGTFSDGVQKQGSGFSFAEGDVTQFQVTGFEDGQSESVMGNQDYFTPTGSMKNRVRFTTGPMTLSKTFDTGWTLRYKTSTVASANPR